MQTFLPVHGRRALLAGALLARRRLSEFGIRARFPLEPGTTVARPVVQRCGDVEVAWIEPPNEGEERPEHPAPLISIGDPPPEASEG
jgi:hypothetical protein